MQDLPGDLASCVDKNGWLVDPSYAFRNVAAEVSENIYKVHHPDWPEWGSPMDMEAVY